MGKNVNKKINNSDMSFEENKQDIEIILIVQIK